MQLFEFQAKQIFKEYAIPVPNGRLTTTAQGAVQAAQELGGAVVVKAQVLSGGRGLAGAIKFAGSLEEVHNVASLILSMKVRGEKPCALLVEEKVQAVRELYAGVTWDYPSKRPVLIASSMGGVEIEAVAKEPTSDVAKMRVDALKGFSDYQARDLARKIGLAGNDVLQYSKILKALWTIFERHDAELVEANPLAVLRNGSLVALDAKLNLDDKSIPRQQGLIGRIKKIPTGAFGGLDDRRTSAKKSGIPTYLEMEGNLGVIADGAGAGMLTLDLVSDFGGQTRVYCEMGGEITPELMENTMMAVLKVEEVKVILINLIGGLNRMDEMAKGIIGCLAKRPSRIPIIVRMSGTKQEEGRQILTASGVGFFDNLYEAVEKAVGFSRSN